MPAPLPAGHEEGLRIERDTSEPQLTVDPGSLSAVSGTSLPLRSSAISSMPWLSRPTIFRGARFATTMTFFPWRSSGLMCSATPASTWRTSKPRSTSHLMSFFDFGTRSAAEYLDKVRIFTTRPPAGTERVERANGDVLLYQASTNTFAVVARDGAPRTMFKPDEGAAYWAEQKARAPDFGRRRSSPD